MAEVRYIFGDILTGEVISELALTGVSLKQTLPGGDFRGNFHLDQTGRDNESLISATIPGRCFVIVERNGVVVGDYILWTRTYQSQAKTVQLYGIPWKAYTETRFVTDTFVATNTEQRNIMISLYEQMQSKQGSIVVNLPAAFPTVVPKSITVAGSEYKTYRQVIDTLADTADGFDWLIRTSRQDNIYTRTLEIGYPQIGALESPGAVTFEYVGTEDGPGGNILNYWINDSMGKAGTHIYGIGGGEGTSMVVQEVVFTDYLDNGFPRYDTDYNRKDISDPTQLLSLTFQQGLIRRPPQSVFTVEVKGEGVEPEFGDYGIGDASRLYIKDARFSEPFEKATRILGWEYYPPEDSNVEMVRLTFEGED